MAEQMREAGTMKRGEAWPGQDYYASLLDPSPELERFKAWALKAGLNVEGEIFNGEFYFNDIGRVHALWMGWRARAVLFQPASPKEPQ